MLKILLLISFLSVHAKAEDWWSRSIVYEIFVRSFQDSDGDGVGDLKGITNRLDYLNSGVANDTGSLGVTAIWLTPIFSSPSYHGYDATDYYSINPAYGNMDDFRELIYESHKRGIKVILDLAVNHTSSKNPWFQAAMKLPQDEKVSSLHDWYVWRNDDPHWK